MKRGVSIAVFFALLALQSQAVSTLLSDNFTAGTTAGWVNSGGTLTIVNDAGIGGGNAMNIVTTSGNKDITKAFGQAITLGTGDYISVTMDYRFTYLTNVSAGVQFRFLDATDSSYSAFGLNPGSTASSSSWFLRNAVVEGSKFANTFTNDLTAKTMTFKVTRDASGALVYVVSWVGGPTFTKTGVVVVNPSDYTFSSFQIAFTTASKCDGLIIDNVNVTSSVKLSGPANLVFTNKFPAAFNIKPFVATNLPVVIRNNGADATNITATLTASSPYFTVLSGTNQTAFIAENGGEVTNLFQVIAATNTPVGSHPSAFTLNLQGYGSDGSLNTMTTNIGVSVLSTVFSSMDKTKFAADTTGTNSALLTVSNTAAWALTFSLSNSQPWLSYPAGVLSIPANTATSITITASGSLTPGQGQYADTLSVTYLNNTSVPNPTNFPILFDVGPKVSFEGFQAVELTNLFTGIANGRIEAGEKILLTITNKNTGAITVSNITTILSADPAYFTVVDTTPTNYPILTVGQETTTTYQVSIASNTPDGNHTFYVTNRVGINTWVDSFSVNVVNRGVPFVSPSAITINVLEGTAVTNTEITVTNSGNAAFTFDISDHGAWRNFYTAVSGNRGVSGFVAAYDTIPLNDPNTNSIYIEAETEGVSAAGNIGFSFPFYGTTYSNFYVTADGYIGLINSSTVPAQSTDRSGMLPLVNGAPVIAPLWGKLKSPVGSIRVIRQYDCLVISYTNISQTAFAGGTNLAFQTALYSDGRIEFRYRNINGTLSNQVSVGVQGDSSSYTNLAVMPVSGTSILLTPQRDQWVRYSPSQSVTVPSLGSQTITFIADASGRTAGSGTNFSAQFSWSTGGSNSVSVTANVTAAAPVYSAVSSLSFTGTAGQVTSVPFVITNTGNGPLSFTISDNVATSATFMIVGMNYNWVDISSIGTAVTLNDPSPNPFITAADEGFSEMLPIGFVFPYFGRSYTQFVASVNGALRLDQPGRIVASRDLRSADTNMPAQMIAPYFGDLMMDENATLKYHSTADRLVVTWENVRQFGLGGGSNQAFQVILDRQGNVSFQYKHLEGFQWPMTPLGVRDVFNGALKASAFVIRGTNNWTVTNYPISGIIYTQYVDSINGFAVLWQPAEIQVISYTPRSGTIPAGGSAVITITGDASNQSVGPNSVATNATLSIAHNASGSPSTLAITFTATNSQETAFARASALEGDSDSDGLADDAERIAGTDPQNAGSVFTVSTTSGRELSWTAAAGRTYTVWYTLNLADGFVPLDGAVGLTANSFTDAVHKDVAVIYYKVTVD